MSWKIKVLKKEGLVSSVCTGLIDYYEIIIKQLTIKRSRK